MRTAKGEATAGGVPAPRVGRCSSRRTAPIGLDRSRAAGFTLIEVLVVIVILGVLAAMLTFAVGSAGGERALEREAERARALLAYACEQAELTGRGIGISVKRDGYRFSELDRDVWLPLRNNELRTRRWNANMAATLTRDGHRVALGDTFPDKPQLLCFSSGELTAFRLELALPEAKRTYRVDGSPDGSVALTAVDSHAR